MPTMNLHASAFMSDQMYQVLKFTLFNEGKEKEVQEIEFNLQDRPLHF